MNSIPFKEQQYHPIRWISKMYGYVLDSYRERHPEIAKMLVKLEEQDTSLSDFTKELEKVIDDSNFLLKKTNNRFEYTNEIFDIVLSFLESGQNIFHFRSELTEMLMNTDVSNVRINSIKLPYNNFYIYFGNNGTKLWDNFHLDGVYVKNLTTEKNEPVLGLMYIGSKSPNIYPEGSDYHVVFDNELHFFDVILYLDGKVETIMDNYKSLLNEEIDNSDLNSVNLDLWKPYMINVYSIVINALLFLTSRSNDIENKYSLKAPHSLVEKVIKAAQRNDLKTKKRTEAIIENLGFRKVKFVGSNVAKILSRKLDEYSVSAHWRRGHWRRQLIGKKLTRNKLIWIEPTLVGTNKKTDIKIKHIYDVGGQNV